MRIGSAVVRSVVTKAARSVVADKVVAPVVRRRNVLDWHADSTSTGDVRAVLPAPCNQFYGAIVVSRRQPGHNSRDLRRPLALSNARHVVQPLDSLHRRADQRQIRAGSGRAKRIDKRKQARKQPGESQKAHAARAKSRPKAGQKVGLFFFSSAHLFWLFRRNNPDLIASASGHFYAYFSARYSMHC